MLHHSIAIGRGTRKRYAGLSLDERILARFVYLIEWDAATDCWPFRGGTIKGGYRSFKVGSRNVMAHRWAYEYFVGPIPTGLTIDHLCRVPRCVNPDHLEAVTQRENNRRGNGFGSKNSLKTTCPRGHRYDTLVRNGVTKTGFIRLARRCSICDREPRR